jgi:Amiloride-sensitive sodium channel
LPSCNSITYHFEVFSEKIRNQSDDSPVKRSLLSIYFADDEFVVLRRSTSFGSVELISKIGGLLVFFLGASVLSAVEVFYFFIIKFVNNIWWN